MEEKRRTEVKPSSIGEKTGYAFRVYPEGSETATFVSALYKTEREAETKRDAYLATGKFEFYGSAE